MKFDLGHVKVHKRSGLPHWNIQHGIYFITFNLFDAIPRYIRERLLEEAEARKRTADEQDIQQWLHKQVDKALDDDYGSCFMRNPRVASIVAGAIQHFDGSRYELLTWCVMPNHIHVVTTLAGGERIDSVIHSWKSFSSKAANKVLNRVGPFWQEDYFDHTIRNSRELRNTVEYVMNNPAKAGLRDWPFARLYPERIPI